jgi:hypothetical protein
MKFTFFLFLGLLTLSPAHAVQTKLFGETGVRGEIWGYPHSRDRFLGASAYHICKRNGPVNVFLYFSFLDGDNEATSTSWKTNHPGLFCNSKKQLTYNGSLCSLKTTVKEIRTQEEYVLNAILDCPNL